MKTILSPEELKLLGGIWLLVGQEQVLVGKMGGGGRQNR